MTDGRRAVYLAFGRIARQAGANHTTPIPTSTAASDGITLTLALPWSDDGPYSAAAALRIASDDGSHEVIAAAADARAIGSHRLFTLTGIRPGLVYTGAMHDGDAIDPLFGPVVLAALFDPDAGLHLPPPPPDPEAPALDEPPPLAAIITDDPDSQGALDAHPADPDPWP